MNKPMIEQSERGVTLNKTLAWSILVALVSGGIWLGTVVTEAKNGLETLSERDAENRQDIATNRRDIAKLRSSNARIDQRLLNIETGVQRAEDSIAEILRYLRESDQ